jgi:hypothetical protein
LSQVRPQELAPLARRTNGLNPKATEPGQLILVTGGGGYIGSVLTERLLDRGYRVRILDRLYWGRKPLTRVLDRIELVEADVRGVPATPLDGAYRRDPPSGLSNDPTGGARPHPILREHKQQQHEERQHGLGISTGDCDQRCQDQHQVRRVRSQPFPANCGRDGQRQTEMLMMVHVAIQIRRRVQRSPCAGR